MKKTGHYWSAVNYPYRFDAFRKSVDGWRFNAHNLESGEMASYLFKGDDEAANDEFLRIKNKNLDGFKKWM